MEPLKNKLLQLTTLRYKNLPTLMNSMKVNDVLDIGDPVSRILKCHLLSEVVLDELLQLALKPNGDAVLSANLSYSKKLSIASRCILAEDYKLLPDFVLGSLRKLNKIRNRLAHELGATVSREEVIELFMGFNHPMPFDPAETEISLIIYHYTAFIFGNMLPKFEVDDIS